MGMVLDKRKIECLILAAILLYFAVCPALPDVPLCPTALFCNTPCPTCGTCRSLWSILHGQLQPAALFNPIGFIAAFALGRRLIYLVFGEQSVARINGKKLNDTLLAAFITCMILVPLLRNAGIMPTL